MNLFEEKTLSDALERTLVNGQHDFEFIDELKNRKELPIWEWVTIDAYCDVHKELRLIVDDLMRVELELLRYALSMDLNKNYVPQKPRKQKKDKKKKRPRKSTYDVFEKRSVEECFIELTELNVDLLKPYHVTFNHQFIYFR
jgi:hypothetical protein